MIQGSAKDRLLASIRRGNEERERTERNRVNMRRKQGCVYVCALVCVDLEALSDQLMLKAKTRDREQMDNEVQEKGEKKMIS